ncbi:MAG TPA: ATP-grasp domain-containing protein [Sedimentisphaerales bacterium]|nr:ATP-grasp domain-containing protein [Sedimentisphaerales bacterium]
MIIGLTYDLRIDYENSGYDQEDIAEFDSEETITLIDRAIQSLGYKTDRIGNARSLSARLVAGEKWDLVFNIAEGLFGRCRESHVPSILEVYNIGYTFSDPLVCAITLDKDFAKRIVRDAGIPTAKFKVIESCEDIDHTAFEYPLFAKPVAEGTGKGINHNSRIESNDQLTQTCAYLLDRFAQPVLVEEFLPGREFTVGILGNGDDAYVLGILEIEMPQDKKGAIYSYVAKEQCEQLVNYLPYRKGSLHGQLEQLALKSYKALQCRDAARVDFRCDRKGMPCFLEINPLPGLHPTHSDLPMIAAAEGMRYEELIGQIINNALKRLK